MCCPTAYLQLAHFIPEIFGEQHKSECYSYKVSCFKSFAVHSDCPLSFMFNKCEISDVDYKTCPPQLSCNTEGSRARVNAFRSSKILRLGCTHCMLNQPSGCGPNGITSGVILVLQATSYAGRSTVLCQKPPQHLPGIPNLCMLTQLVYMRFSLINHAAVFNSKQS